MTESQGHWVSLFVDRKLSIYFDSFGIEYISLEVLNKVKDKSINHNIFRIKNNKFITCGFYCVAFIECMLSGKNFVRLYQFIFSK